MMVTYAEPQIRPAACAGPRHFDGLPELPAKSADDASKPAGAGIGGRIHIRVAASDQDLESIYRFRYRIYVEEMGRRQRYADPILRRIEDPLDQGAINLAAFVGSEIVGAVRINFPRDSDIGEYEEFYHLSSVGPEHPAHTSINTRLMILSKYRKSRLAVRMAIASYEYGVVRGIRWSFIDCNPHLIPFFRGLGYEEHVPPAVHPEYGLVTRMRLDVLNAERLSVVRSPFLRSLNRLRESINANV